MSPVEPGDSTDAPVKPTGDPVMLDGCPLPANERPAVCGYAACQWLSCICTYPPPPEEDECEQCLSGYELYKDDGGKLSKHDWHEAGHPDPEYKKQVSCDFIHANEENPIYKVTDTMQKTYADVDSVRQYQYVCDMFDLSDKRDQNISNVKKMFELNTDYTQAAACDHNFIGAYIFEEAVTNAAERALDEKPEWCPGPKDL